MERDRRRDRPTVAEVEKSLFKMKRVNHYSKDTLRKVDMGRKAIESGQNATDVCLRLFNVHNQELVDLMLNQSENTS